MTARLCSSSQGLPQQDTSVLEHESLRYTCTVKTFCPTEEAFLNGRVILMCRLFDPYLSELLLSTLCTHQRENNYVQIPEYPGTRGTTWQYPPGPVGTAPEIWAGTRCTWETGGVQLYSVHNLVSYSYRFMSPAIGFSHLASHNAISSYSCHLLSERDRIY